MHAWKHRVDLNFKVGIHTQNRMQQVQDSTFRNIYMTTRNFCKTLNNLVKKRKLFFIYAF